MTDMEHAIEQVARVIGPLVSGWDLDGRPDVEIDMILARALYVSGLLAPAPLREEWGSELQGARPESSSHVLYARDSDNAKWQIENNPDHATGRVMHRYRTDWLPVNSDDEADQ